MSVARWRRVLRLGVIYPVLARLPHPLRYHSATALGIMDGWWHADLRIALTNGLCKAYPELRASPATLDRWISLHARMLAREVMDAHLLPRLDVASVQSLVNITGLDALHGAASEGRGVILVMAHYSRLIMLLAALGMQGVRMSMLTMRIDETNPELLPVERRYLQRKVAGLLSIIGGQWLSVGQSLRPMYDGLTRGEIWIVLFDAHIPGFGQPQQYPFLGGRLSVSRGVERIAAKTGAQVVYASVTERSATALQGRLVRINTTPSAIMAAAIAELERDIAHAPWQWWQWNILDYIWTCMDESV